MFTPKGAARLGLVALAKLAILTACLAVILMTTACGIKVGSADFAAFRLSEPDQSQQQKP